MSKSWGIKIVGVSVALIIALLSGCGSKPLPAANQDTVVTIGSAATVKVFAFGDMKISFPSGVGLKRAASDPNAISNEPLTLLEAEFRRDLQSRTLEDGTTYADYAWAAIGKDPERYLVFTGDRTVLSQSDVSFATGSGFVLTSDGHIVTCQHCVQGGPVPGFINQEIYDGFLRVMREKIGAAASEGVMTKSARGIIDFLIDHAQAEAIFKEARVLIPQVPKDTNGYNSLTREETSNSLLQQYLPSSSAQIRKWTWSCAIVASGEGWPGKDVAVLKIPANNLLTLGVSREASPRPDSTVLCLGFPGKAVQQGAMTKEAQFRVILHGGRVGQLLPTRSGFDAIHTDADINHGDSGGPGMNDSGAVIGLSVSGQEDVPGQNYLVPASVILERMKEAGVTESNDQLNKDWREGLLLLQAKRFAEAKAILEKVRNAQGGDNSVAKHLESASSAGPNSINLFLDRAIKDCDEGLKTR
ncbi:MAG: trypsin-like peptidase domain-containing protein [Armatimonadetes bacterium]|nr:trypsin-like peptidase domain-containing protein [Armatimonadota bacterium]